MAQEMEAYVKALRERKEIAYGTEKDVAQQHKKGRLTARERVNLLFDPDTFTEIDTLVTPRVETYVGGKTSRYGDGVITGFGEINGRRAFVAAQDATVMGGSLGEMHAQKIVKAMKMALSYGAPFIALNDSGGARIQEGVDSLAGYAQIFDANCEASGVIPQLSVIMGPCAGGAVYSPALTDFVFMTENSYMFITGPDVVKAVTHEDVTSEELGGASVHSAKSGVCHVVGENETQTLLLVREMLTYLPQNNMEDPPFEASQDDPLRADPELDTVVPDSPNKPYDMKDIINRVIDDGVFYEIQPEYAANIVVGFARLGGHSVGIIANQPMVLAGVLDIKASEKAGRFIRFCDCFNLPIITFVDVPGYLPGTEQEHNGIIASGAKLLYAYCEATVPKLTV
ncbi:MAG: acyl-CoA carboxylase subunit beta, partial [Anaerolineales bacterium]|nr:acyl-CoA carboxylase subunit beta [Anaerolineales bacterium]